MRVARLACAATVAALVITAPSAEAGWRSAPIVPRIAGATQHRIEARLESEAVREHAFAKVGDSISYDETFLQGFGCGSSDLGSWARLAPTVRYFRRPVDTGMTPELCAPANSFSRRSVATVPGKTAPWALASGELRHELAATRPAWALVMFGTNDASARLSVAKYRRALEGIVSVCLRRATTPILFTLPFRRDDPTLNPLLGAYSDAVLRVGRERRIPVVNLRRALAAPNLIDAGLSTDGEHLSVLGGPGGTAWDEAHRATELTPEGLRYGSNLRNLLTLRTLARLSRR